MNKSMSLDRLDDDDLFVPAAPSGLAPKHSELDTLQVAHWGSKVMWVTLHAIRGLKKKGLGVHVYGWLGPAGEAQKPNSSQRRHRLVYRSEKKKSDNATWDHECWEFLSRHCQTAEDCLHVQVLSTSKRVLGAITIDLRTLSQMPTFSRDGKNAQAYMSSLWRPLHAVDKKGGEKHMGDILISLWPYCADPSVDIACRRNDVASLERLLGEGYPTEFVGSQDTTHVPGWAAMETAAQHGHLDVVRLLLRHGASLAYAGHWGQTTALHDACTQAQLALVTMLLTAAQGADVNARDWDEQTPLHRAADSWAAEEPRIEIIRLLKAAGADPHLVAADGKNAIERADSEEIRAALLA